MVAMIGRFIPISRAAAVNTSPTTTCFQPLKLNFFWIRPNTTANAMKSSEIHPAAPFALALSARDTTPSVSTYALNVPATMSANAAITISVNSQQKPRNRRRPVLPMYFSIRSPMDLPSFLTLAYSAPKSVTAPKKMPPNKIQRSTGSHPNAAA